MATSIITGTVTDPTGAALPSVPVVITLVPKGAFRSADGSEVAPVYTTTTNASGVWTATLERNSGITPANSYYVVEERLSAAQGGPRRYAFQVGAANQTLLAALVSPIPDLPASTYLTQAAGDARYQQLAGYGGTSDITNSRPADAVAAGVATTAARSDHKHSRETIYGTAAARAALASPDPVNGQSFIESDTLKWYDRIAAAWKQVGKWIIDTAANKPSTNYAGQAIYVTDASNITGTGIATPDTTSQPARGHGLWFYNGTRWQMGEWNKPWGIMGTAQATTNQTGISAEADVTSVTVTFTAAANRRYKITVTGRILQQTSTGIAEVKITDGSNNLQDKWSFGLTASQAAYCNVIALVSPAAGSVTYKARMSTTAGTVDTTAASTQPFRILIEDIGPNGAPA